MYARAGSRSRRPVIGALDLPYERDTVSSVKGELDEPPVEKYGDEIPGQKVPVVQDEPILRGRPQYDLEFIPEWRSLAEAGKHEVRRVAVKRRDLKPLRNRYNR